MIWRYLVRPVLFRLPAESAHYFSMGCFASSNFWPLAPLTRSLFMQTDPRLRTAVCGLEFPNPIGLAAGFDKDGRWFNALANLGFGHVEIGTLTAHPQPGNDRPRLFRLPKDRALINRMGFNNSGSQLAAERLARTTIRPILGINIGKSKITPLETATDDYLTSLERVYAYASYLTVNVSSPNTPGLRKLQNRDALLELLSSIVSKAQDLASEKNRKPVPIFLKIAPDLSQHQLDDVIEIVGQSKVDAVIATNTTIDRSGLQTPAATVEKMGDGGLSGSPLTTKSRELVAHLFRGLDPNIPVIGVGGIMTGEDAWQMIGAGARLIQVYTGFIYGGPFFVKQLNRYLLTKLDEFEFENIDRAVGHQLL